MDIKQEIEQIGSNKEEGTYIQCWQQEGRKNAVGGAASNSTLPAAPGWRQLLVRSSAATSGSYSWDTHRQIMTCSRPSNPAETGALRLHKETWSKILETKIAIGKFESTTVLLQMEN